MIGGLVLDRQPQFPLPTEQLPSLPPPPANTHSMNTATARVLQLAPEMSDAMDIYRDLKTLTAVIDSQASIRGNQIWQDEMFIGLRLNPIAHRLLSIPSTVAVDNPQSPLGEAFRLAALCFVIAIKRRCNSYPGSMPQHAAVILKALKDIRAATPEFLTLRLWILVLCGVVTSDWAQRQAVISAIIDVMLNASLESWDAVMAHVKVLPWIDSLFGNQSTVLGAEVIRDFAIPRY